MKKSILKLVVIGAAVLSWVGLANAVTYTATQSITTSGQAFDFNVSGVQTSTGTGLFTIEANGDYTPTFTYLEGVLTWNIDNLYTNNVVWGPDNADASVQNSFNDVYWKKSIVIDASTMSVLTSDHNLKININNGIDVNPFNEYDPDWLSYTLTYDNGSAPVPEPGTMALLGLGMAGLAIYGKRRQNKV
jgi:hypothetical protein